MTVQYQSSKGPMAIETMPTPYMINALAKLQREADPARSAEIEAMSAQLAEREAQEADAPPPAGHNNPPEETPPAPLPAAATDTWGAIQAHLDDLLTEARNWADGTAIENQAQANEVARLQDQLREGEGAADDARKLERAPHDVVIEEIQGRYNVYIAPVKNRVPGKVPLARQALANAQTAWLRKVEAANQAEAARLRAIADAELAAAAEKVREAHKSSDLGAVEAAEEIFAEAKATERQATQAETVKAHAFGEGKATGLKTYWETAISDPVIALRWAWANYRPRLEALALDLAKAEVREGKRQIDGFSITSDRRV